MPGNTSLPKLTVREQHIVDQTEERKAAVERLASIGKVRARMEALFDTLDHAIGTFEGQLSLLRQLYAQLLGPAVATEPDGADALTVTTVRGEMKQWARGTIAIVNRICSQLERIDRTYAQDVREIVASTPKKPKRPFKYSSRTT